MSALISDLPRKNGWTIAEHAGDLTPDPTQRLLNHAVWDHDQVQGVVRRYVAEHLGGQDLVVAALDESGQEKQGQSTAGVKRQYMGCAGRIANGVNTVYCSYATSGGHALVGAAIYVPEDQLTDPDRRAALGIPQKVAFKTKPQLAQDILADAIADDTMPRCRRGLLVMRSMAVPARCGPSSRTTESDTSCASDAPSLSNSHRGFDSAPTLW